MSNNFNNDINRDKFISTLIELSTITLTTYEDIEFQVQNLKEVYDCSDDSPGYRHYYSDIFKAIVQIKEKKECDELMLVYNLDSIMDYCKNNENNKFILKINKLYDHTNLEVAKLEHTSQQIKKIDEKTSHIEFIKSEVDKHTEENKKLKEDLDKQIESNAKSNSVLKDELDKHTYKIEEMQKQYITILGIFASIVLTSTTAISISSSILQSFHEGSIYRISLVSTGLVFVLFNVMYILTRFIQEINKKEGERIKYPVYMWVLNAICILAVIGTIVIKYYL